MKKRTVLISVLVLVLMFTSVFTACSSKGSETESNEVQKTEVKSDASKEEGKSSEWPKKAIQIVVPYNPGGDTDFNARMYANYLKDILGVSVVVTNVTGSGGTVGSRHAKNSEPDGYTVLFYHTAMHVNEASSVVDYGSVDFDISCVAAKSAGDVITVRSDSPYNTLDEAVNDSKENPGEVTFAANTGATTYLMGTMINEDGANFNLVDMGGGSERVAALKGGHVDIIPSPFGIVKPYIDSGDFKPLAIMTKERNKFAPDIPTAIEQGYNNTYLPINYFFSFPKGTPKEIVEKWADAVEQASQIPEYGEEIKKAYYQEPYVVKGEEASKIVNGQRETILGFKDLLTVKK